MIEKNFTVTFGNFLLKVHKWLLFYYSPPLHFKVFYDLCNTSDKSAWKFNEKFL